MPKRPSSAWSPIFYPWKLSWVVNASYRVELHNIVLCSSKSCHMLFSNIYHVNNQISKCSLQRIKFLPFPFIIIHFGNSVCEYLRKPITFTCTRNLQLIFNNHYYLQLAGLLNLLSAPRGCLCMYVW